MSEAGDIGKIFAAETGKGAAKAAEYILLFVAIVGGSVLLILFLWDRIVNFLKYVFPKPASQSLEKRTVGDNIVGTVLYAGEGDRGLSDLVDTASSSSNWLNWLNPVGAVYNSLTATNAYASPLTDYSKQQLLLHPEYAARG